MTIKNNPISSAARLSITQSARATLHLPARMTHAALRVLNERVMFPRRYAFLSEALAPFLAGAESILDVGSSNGRLISRITKGLRGAHVVGVDVHVQPDRVIPIERYDGARLPFPNGSFDSVVLIDVLHHADDPAALLSEAARVARDHVLIKDHYFRTQMDWQILKWADYGGNAPHGIRLPCNYLNLPAWYAAIQGAGLDVLVERPFTRYSYDPCKHIIFHLKKPKQPEAVALRGRDKSGRDDAAIAAPGAAE